MFTMRIPCRPRKVNEGTAEIEFSVLTSKDVTISSIEVTELPEMASSGHTGFHQFFDVYVRKVSKTLNLRSIKVNFAD